MTTQSDIQEPQTAGRIMPVVRVPGPFQPTYCVLQESPELGAGWRILDTRCGEKVVDDVDFKFATQRDCARSCDSLNEATSDGEDIYAVSYERFKFLLVRYLAW